jgi:hypothetical protein
MTQFRLVCSCINLKASYLAFLTSLLSQYLSEWHLTVQRKGAVYAEDEKCLQQQSIRQIRGKPTNYLNAMGYSRDPATCESAILNHVFKKSFVLHALF